MIIGKEIQNHRNDIVKSLQELVQIKSVKDEACEGKPFGQGVGKALEYMRVFDTSN